MTDSQPTLGRRKTRSQARLEASAAPEALPAAAAAAVEPAAPSEAEEPSTAATASAAAAGKKRPRKEAPTFTEDDFSCPCCLNLLLDPVVYGCGHDVCELCHRRWTGDQGKRSCPVCRAPLAAGPAGELPGVCLRLARTIEALFPERIKQRQAEVAADKAALAEERRQRAEERRRAEQQRRSAAQEQDWILQAVLEQLMRDDAFPPLAAAGQQQQQRRQPQQAEGRQPARGPATRSRAAAPPPQPAPQQQQQQQQQQPRGPFAALQAALSSMARAIGGAGGQPAPTQQGQQAQLAQQGQQPQQAQQAQQRQQAGEREATFEIRFFHFVHQGDGPGAPPALAQPQQAQVHRMQMVVPLAGQPGGPAAAAAAAGAGAGARGGGSGSAAWPNGPPLEDMEFNLGWGEGNRRRRGSRRGSGGSSRGGRS